MAVECPACDRASEEVYRCEHCGKDLTAVDATTTGQQTAVGGDEP